MPPPHEQSRASASMTLDNERSSVHNEISFPPKRGVKDAPMVISADSFSRVDRRLPVQRAVYRAK